MRARCRSSRDISRKVFSTTSRSSRALTPASGITLGASGAALGEQGLDLPRLLGRQWMFQRDTESVVPELIEQNVLRDPADVPVEGLFALPREAKKALASVGQQPFHDFLSQIVEERRAVPAPGRKLPPEGPADQRFASPQQDAPEGIVRTRHGESAQEFPRVHAKQSTRRSLSGCGESAPHPPGRWGSPALRGRTPMRGALSTGCYAVRLTAPRAARENRVREKAEEGSAPCLAALGEARTR